MSLEFNGQKLKITYPCQWSYKVIGMNKESVRHAIEEVIQSQAHSLEPSNQSRTGKYCSLTLTITAQSEKNRKNIHRQLHNHPDIRMVI